jgi:hypothetical protein
MEVEYSWHQLCTEDDFVVCGVELTFTRDTFFLELYMFVDFIKYSFTFDALSVLKKVSKKSKFVSYVPVASYINEFS